MTKKLKLRFPFVALLVLIAALAAPAIAFAGGWAVITLDKTPETVVAGQSYTVGMMARQHGKTPWQVDSLRIEASHAESGEKASFTALPQGEPGHYQAELLFPVSGRWEWSISTGLHPEFQPMPALNVAAGSAAAANTPNEAAPAGLVTSALPPALLGVFALLAFLAGAMMIVRGRAQKRYSLAGVGLMLLCGVLVFAFFSSANAQAKQAQPETASVEPSQKEIGQQLFLAKGCVVCHTNDRAIQGSEQYGVNFGPNLSNYRNDPQYLHQLLKDPKSVKATSEMPDLGLKLVEIEALIAFINDED